MKINLLYFIRLFLRHLPILFIVPVFMAALVYFLTEGKPKEYQSKTKIYTGIASGSSIESLENQRFDLFATNTAFDNLINIIKAENTIELVSLELFTRHMLMDKPDPKIISAGKYNRLLEIVPDSIKDKVVKNNFETTYLNFIHERDSGHENFVYKMLNLNHPDYSTKKILNKITVRRISNSDMLEIIYRSEDPGICQNTLEILSRVFMRLYSDMKVNQSDAVVGYFSKQLAEASDKLRIAEDELLEFNRSNNIINYYEQTKHIASQKEHFELEYQSVQMQHEASKRVTIALETRMSSRQKQRLASQEVINIRNQIAEINMQIAMKSLELESDSVASVTKGKELAELQLQSNNLNEELRKSIDTLYWADNNIEGLGTSTILNDWLNSVIELEGSRAQLEVLDKKRIEFNELYELFAPLGATMKRLERAIDVAEQEYLSLLHSLGLAKLKQQNIELSSNVKVIDSPNYPITPQPSKQKILVAIAGILGFILVAFSILLLEFLDTNIKTEKRAEEFTGLKPVAVFPKIPKKKTKVDINYIENKATEAFTRQILFNSKKICDKQENTKIHIFVSTLKGDGKTFLLNRVAAQLAEFGNKILVISPDAEKFETNGFETQSYISDNKLYNIGDLQDLPGLPSDLDLSEFDKILVELPAIIHNAYPIDLISGTSQIFLVCRANRSWANSDKKALSSMKELSGGVKPALILNGVDNQEMEDLLGDLPKKRSFLRKMVKNMLLFRFFSKNSLLL